MTSEERLQIVHYLFAAAWVDGSLAAEESELLATLLSSLSFSREEMSVVEPWFSRAPDEPDWSSLSQDRELGEAVLRQAFVLTGADRTFTVAEIEFLERLRSRAGIEEARFQTIWREIETLLVQGRETDAG